MTQQFVLSAIPHNLIVIKMGTISANSATESLIWAAKALLFRITCPSDVWRQAAVRLRICL